MNCKRNSCVVGRHLTLCIMTFFLSTINQFFFRFTAYQKTLFFFSWFHKIKLRGHLLINNVVTLTLHIKMKKKKPQIFFTHCIHLWGDSKWITSFLIFGIGKNNKAPSIFWLCSTPVLSSQFFYGIIEIVEFSQSRAKLARRGEYFLLSYSSAG